MYEKVGLTFLPPLGSATVLLSPWMWSGEEWAGRRSVIITIIIITYTAIISIQLIFILTVFLRKLLSVDSVVIPQNAFGPW